jgi:serine/threonine protein kinase
MMSTDAAIKIIDFGLAVDYSTGLLNFAFDTIFASNEFFSLHMLIIGPRYQMVGSPLWMAPEMIRGEPYTSSGDC